MIRQYQNNVFTNQGDCTVEEFDDKLAKAEDDLNLIEGLVVYVGFHGDGNGNWGKGFNGAEKRLVVGMTAGYKHRPKLEWLEALLTDEQIVAVVRKGKVLFSWCNSDTKVPSVMREHGLTPTLVKDYA